MDTTFTRVFWLTGAAATAMLAAAPTGYAQTEVEDTAADGGVERLIVTARRREETLQDVPVAVSAFSENRIAELQADDLSGLQYAAPNFYFDEGDASNAVIYIRGSGQNDSLAFADPGVGVYVDDVFIARSQAAFLELFDVDRVEVLRGPQGTLYGRNTIGGAVKFISREPTDEFEAYVEAGAGNFDFFTAKGRVSGPLIDGVLRAKAAVAYTRRDGYNTNLFDGEDNGDQDSLSGRVGLYWDARDDLSFALTLDGRRERPDSARSPTLVTDAFGFPDPVNDPFTVATFQPPADPFDVNTNASTRSDTDSFGVTLRSTWDATDTLTVESITAYREFEFDVALDTDATPLPLLDVFVDQDQKQFSQELRVVYDNGDRINATAGLYYFFDDDLSFSGVDNVSAGFDLSAFGLGPVNLFQFTEILGLPPFATSSLADTDQTTNSYAAFAHGTYQATDRLSLSAGLRYTFEEKESARRFENFFDPDLRVVPNPPPFLQGLGTPGVTIEGEDDFDAFTPKFEIAYDVSEDILAYASVGRGFKSGGFDGRANNDAAFEPFDPEFVWSYEAGLKSSWLDNRLVVNAAYFFNDFTDLQVTSFAADPDTGVFVSQFTNAAEATVQGVELELFATPYEGLTLNGSFGYVDAEYQEFDILVGGVPTDVSDRPLVNTPEFNGSIAATYVRPFGQLFEGTVHVDANYRGETATEISATPELTQDAYWLTNAFAAVGTQNGRWQLRGGVRNISDEEIQVQGFNLTEFPGLQSAFFAAPRTYDVRVIFRY